MTDFQDFGSKGPTPSPAEITIKGFDQSADLGKLFESLSKAQGEMLPATLDRENPHYKSKYATLSACKESYQGPLSANGLSLLQQVFSAGGRYFIRTMLGHSSGQWVSCIFEILIDKKHMQGLGSAASYGRRYGINALLGVVDVEDDDAEGAVNPPLQDPAREPSPVKPKHVQAGPSARVDDTTDPDAPSRSQIVRLFAIADEQKWTKEQIKEFMISKWSIDSTSDLVLWQYGDLIYTIQSKTFGEAKIELMKSKAGSWPGPQPKPGV